MTDMVEQVAKAIWESRCGETADRYNYQWEHLASDLRAANIRHARAAISALMEPTEEMYDGSVLARQPSRACWQAMLKAALDD